MGFFDFLTGRDAAMSSPARDAGDDGYFPTMMTARSEINVTVTVERARQVPVIRDCLQILSDSAAGLEFALWRQIDAMTRERVEDHPVLRLMRNPNRRQTSFEFLEQLVDDLHTYGDAMFRIDRDDATGEILELWRVDPDPSVTRVEEIEDGTKRFVTQDRAGVEQVYLEDEVWHIPKPPSPDGLRGRSPILQDGREAVAVAIALQRYANILFTNDATPPFMLSMDSHFADPDGDRKRFMKAWRKWTTGANRHLPGVGEYGMKPHRMGLSSEEAQFLETRKELWLDLTRLFRVPPHKVGILDRSTNNNIEHQSIEFVTDTLRPIIELIERSVSKFLIAETDVYFEFNVESLLRGDIKSRYEAYALGRQWGWFSVNDVLAMEHRNGIGQAGDRYVEPLNMVPVGTGSTGRDAPTRAGIDRSIAFLRESVARNGGRPRLEIVNDAA